jgi:hypothetical protein
MAQAIDTLGYVQRLREAGVDQRQAEAHASAARDYIMPEVATKADVDRLDGKLDTAIARLEATIERQTLQLTVRLGGMIIMALGAVATFVKLFP